MELLNIFMRKSHNEGFTLLEVLLILAILSVLARVTTVYGIDTYRAELFRAEQRTLVSLLERARAESMNNSGAVAHGVAFFPDDYQGYVLFAGATYSQSNPGLRLFVPVHYSVALSVPSEIIFSPRSGDTHVTGDISLSDISRLGYATATIKVNQSGYIGW